MGKFKFDAEGRKLLRNLTERIQELDAHVVVFTESILSGKEGEEAKEDTTPISAEIARSQINAATKALSHVVTKVSIAWKDEISHKEFSETVTEVENAVTALIQVYKALVAMNVTAGAWGDMVVVPLQKAIQAILSDVGGLVSDFYSLKKTKEELRGKKKGAPTKKEEPRGNEVEKVSPHMTGLVWEGCKVLDGLPLDNVTAAALELKRWAETAKDAMDEIKEIAEAQKEREAPGTEKEKEKEDDSGDSDDWEEYEEDSWTEEEQKVLPGMVLILRCSYGLLNGINSLLEKNVSAPKTSNEGRSQCAWLKELIAHASTLLKYVDEAGVCVYPPQNKDFIRANFDNLAEHIQTLLNLVNTNEELKANARCVKMGELVNMLLDSAKSQIAPYFEG